jgi:hypothetical protein
MSVINMFRRTMQQWQSLSTMKKVAIIGGPPLVLGTVNSLMVNQSVNESINEMREFPLNSANAQLMDALDTGDVIVFSRRMDGRVSDTLSRSIIQSFNQTITHSFTQQLNLLFHQSPTDQVVVYLCLTAYSRKCSFVSV